MKIPDIRVARLVFDAVLEILTRTGFGMIHGEIGNHRCENLKRHITRIARNTSTLSDDGKRNSVFTGFLKDVVRVSTYSVGRSVLVKIPGVINDAFVIADRDI